MTGGRGKAWALLLLCHHQLLHHVFMSESRDPEDRKQGSRLETNPIKEENFCNDLSGQGKDEGSHPFFS